MRNSGTQSTLHAQLRRATHAHHVALNRNPMLSPIMEKRISLDEYTRLLKAYLPLYGRIESGISQSLIDYLPELFYTHRYKAAWLHQDLRVLRCDFAVRPGLEACVPSQPVNAAELIGLLYVIEGSTLGGQVIFRHLSERFDIGFETGLRFFYGYGNQTQPRWDEFITIASTKIDNNKGAIDCALEFACRTFSGISDYLNYYYQRECNYG